MLHTDLTYLTKACTEFACFLILLLPHPTPR
jgi:hypothetical protein